MAELDPQLKTLIEALSSAVTALLSKIEAGDPGVADEIAKVRATDSDLKSALASVPPAAA